MEDGQPKEINPPHQKTGIKRNIQKGKKMEIEKIEEAVLEDVSGGARKGTEELEAFIKKVDPDYPITSYGSIFGWLDRRASIQFMPRGIVLNENSANNQFRLKDGRRINQRQLMEMLREKFNVEGSQNHYLYRIQGPVHPAFCDRSAVSCGSSSCMQEDFFAMRKNSSVIGGQLIWNTFLLLDVILKEYKRI